MCRSVQNADPHRRLSDSFTLLEFLSSIGFFDIFCSFLFRKHLHKYDQNIFDGLSRVIVYHLERQEITESLPYIEKAWKRLQKIPGKDSFDFYVVNKLHNAVQNKKDFCWSEFCCRELT